MAEKNAAVLALESLERVVNGMNSPLAKEVAAYVPYMHRTLQQSLMREFLIPALKALAASGTDLRNESAVAAAAKMLAALEGDEYFPFI